ncbi:MAG: hypothetical protein KAS32_28385 [Candidatus Peribacteraceae bacterium]|nr:hypothetical protein [Candidatus Peribacteraceae bacterium]
MSREILLRAWDKKRGEWYRESDSSSLTFKDFAVFGECTMLCTPSITDLQYLDITQTAGITDINGGHIYENDILLWNDTHWVCSWNKRMNRMFFESIDSFLRPPNVKKQWGEWHWSTERACRAVEVVGNIYENPELLS